MKLQEMSLEAPGNATGYESAFLQWFGARRFRGLAEFWSPAVCRLGGFPFALYEQAGQTARAYLNEWVQRLVDKDSSRG